MSDSENKNQPASSPPPGNGKATVSSRLAQFEKRQKELWRITFLILLVLATVFVLINLGVDLVQSAIDPRIKRN